MVGTFRAVRARLAHRRVDLLDQPDFRPRPRTGDRLQPVHRLPVPRRAAARALASTTRSYAPSRPRAARSRSRPDVAVSLSALLVFPLVLPALVRLRRHRASCSWRCSARWCCCRRCWPCMGTARLAPQRKPKALKPGSTTASGTAWPPGDAPAGVGRVGVGRPAARLLGAPFLGFTSGCRTTACSRPAADRARSPTMLRTDFSSDRDRRLPGRRAPHPGDRAPTSTAYAAGGLGVADVARVDAVDRSLRRRHARSPPPRPRPRRSRRAAPVWLIGRPDDRADARPRARSWSAHDPRRSTSAFTTAVGGPAGRPRRHQGDDRSTLPLAPA